MTLIDGIGDEVTQFFVAVFALFIVIFAWWSTNISEPRQVRTVVLLDRRRRRPIIRRLITTRRLTNHTETTTISEGTSSTTNISETVEENSNSNMVAPPIRQVTTKPSEASTSASNGDSIPADTGQESEEQNIIETMDSDQNVVRIRFRRIAHFENSSRLQSDGGSSTESEPVDVSQSSNLENEIDTSSKCSEIPVNPEPDKEDSESDINIKLKYINDEVRIVTGDLKEPLGDFKRRHFQEELNSDKIIRLIFNGQLLKQDTQTLQGCGLFDNCVVHCLIHQKRTESPQQTPSSVSSTNNYFQERPFEGLANTNNNNQGFDWDFGNFLFALVSITLLAAWYFRYVYAHLYTVTATIGLILITGIFTIVLVGVYFPDAEQITIPTIRIARPEQRERAEVQE